MPTKAIATTTTPAVAARAELSKALDLALTLDGAIRALHLAAQAECLDECDRAALTVVHDMIHDTWATISDHIGAAAIALNAKKELEPAGGLA